MSKDAYVVTAAEIAAMAGLKKTHFLNPNAVRVNKSLGDLTGLTGFGFHLIEIEPGHESTEYHVHHHEDEAVYILSGTATVDIGGELTEVSAGDFIGYRKGGAAHTMTNTGTETLRCLVVGERGRADTADYPRLKKRIYRNPGMEWNLVDHEHIATPTAGAKN